MLSPLQIRYVESSPDYPLVKKFGLVYERNNQHLVSFAQPISERSKFPRIHAQSKLWYRAMTAAEFYHLLKNDQVEIARSYRGITESKEYAKSYMGNDLRATHLVEFRLYDINLHDELTKDLDTKGLDTRNNAQFAKVEDGATSFGLGPSGHYAGKAGSYFNNLILHRGVMWSLVCLNIALK